MTTTKQQKTVTLLISQITSIQEQADKKNHDDFSKTLQEILVDLD